MPSAAPGLLLDVMHALPQILLARGQHTPTEDATIGLIQRARSIKVHQL